MSHTSSKMPIWVLNSSGYEIVYEVASKEDGKELTTEEKTN